MDSNNPDNVNPPVIGGATCPALEDTSQPDHAAIEQAHLGDPDVATGVYAGFNHPGWSNVLGIAGAGFLGSFTTSLFIGQGTHLDTLRRALEIIAVGDSKDPRADAEQALIDAGIWRAAGDLQVDVALAALGPFALAGTALDAILAEPHKRLAQAWPAPAEPDIAKVENFDQLVVYLLERSLWLISQPGGWGQRAFYPDGAADIDSAKCFCLLGALWRARRDAVRTWDGAASTQPFYELAGNAEDRAAQELLVTLRERGDSRALPRFNDAPDTTLGVVQQLFRDTVERMRQGAPT